MVLTVNPSTCPVCQSIFLGEFPGDFQTISQDPHEWRKSLVDLERSAKDGCCLCQVFREWFRKEIYGSNGLGPQEAGTVGEDVSLKIRCLLTENPQAISISTSDWSGWLTYRVLTTSDDPIAHRILGRVPDRDVVSDDTFERARKWIATCNDSHGDCVNLVASSLPTRVIDVRPPNEPDSARVWISKGTKAPYVALSYCWGSSNYRTTRDTLESHSRRLPYQMLPQTIKDTIYTTRQLGLRYLWVDSLCIIQDSEEDLARELALMEDIFKNAYITISAACARDCQSGFLYPRHSSSILPGEDPICLPYRCTDGALGTVGLFRHSYNGTRRDPIHERAWTLMEHLLSPRLLIYGTTQLFWSCASKMEQDGELITLGNRVKTDEWDLMKQNLSPSATVPERGANNARESGYIWEGIPGEYPRPGITEPFNRLFSFACQLWFPRSERLLSYLSREQNYTPDSSESPSIQRLRELVYSWKDTIEVYSGQRLSQPFATLFVSSAMWTIQHIDLYHERPPVYQIPEELARLQKDVPENIAAMNPDPPFGRLLADCARVSSIKCIVDDAEHMDHLAFTWKDIVQEYSSRKLSNPLDKLPALSAIVSAFARTAQDEYVLGHWKAHLLPQLLWASKHPDATRSVWRCPTWSWLSIDGPVDIWPENLENLAETGVAEVIGYSATPVWDYAPYGRIKSSFLIVNGWLKRIVLDTEKMTALPETPIMEYDQPIDVYLDCPNEYLKQHPKPIEGGPPDRKWCLTLVRWVPHFQWMLGKKDVAQAMGGLILNITERGAERIGSFSCNRIREGDFSLYKEGPAVFIWTSFWLISGERSTVTLI